MAVKRFYFFGSYSSAPTFRPFIIQINSGADSSFTIPTFGGGYNYKVSTSDGQTFTGVTGNLTITFPDANTLYDISISGDFPWIIFNNGTQRLKLIDIKQWGDIEWTLMDRAFFGCSNMTCSATDTPNLSSVANMYAMYYMCEKFNAQIINYDYSNISNLSRFISGCIDFNQELPSYFPNVTNFSYALQITPSLDKNLNMTFDKKVNMDEFITESGVKDIEITFLDGCLSMGGNTFRNVPCERLVLNGMDKNFSIVYLNNTLYGASIDNLANSVADMTGQTSPTVTMTTAQYNSCDTSIWTNKNWTIAQV